MKNRPAALRFLAVAALPVMALFAAAALVLSAGVAQAATIYTLTGQNTATFSVTGTITTDGTLGILNAGNVTGFSISINGGTPLTNLTSFDRVMATV